MNSEEAPTPTHRLATPSDEPSRLFVRIFNLLFWPYMLVSCVVLFIPALLIWLLTFWWDRRLRALSRFTCFWGAHYLTWAPRNGITIEGLAHAQNQGPCVYVSNHQSMVDILAIFATRLPFKWVSKIENFYAPFLGWNMVLNGYVPLKRGYLPSILRMVRKCNAVLKRGDSLFVFPEGTRSDDGELGPFFRGAFRIAVRNRVPIVPIVLDGTDKVLPKGRFLIVPGRVRLHILERVDPSSVDYDHKRLHDVVRARMLEEQAKMKDADRMLGRSR